MSAVYQLKYLGDYLYSSGDFMAAAKALEQSLEISKSIVYDDLEGAYDLLGITYSRLGDYNQAIKYVLKNIKIY